MNNLGKDENKENDFRLPVNLQGNPFSVPSNYFPTLEQSILTSIKIDKLSESVFSTPQEYQSHLTHDVLARIGEEKLKSSIVADGFTVPQTYFKEVREEILQQTVNEPKIVPLKKSRTAWLSYAAAACVAVAISVFALLQTADSVDENNAIEQVNIDVLPTEEIINYLAFYSETGDLMTLSDQLSEEPYNFTDSFSSEEIESYLENSI